MRRCPDPLRLTCDQSSGFTLLEVVIALAIFVGSIAALSRLYLLGIENAEYSQWQTIATLIAESHLAELDAGVITVDDRGPYEDDVHSGWQWTLDCTELAQDGLYEVIILVEKYSEGPGKGFSTKLSRWYFDSATTSGTGTGT